MSVVGGLFSDVFKSQGMTVPGSEGSIDWSKAGGNPADLNWAAIKPFQVIPPMSWAATNKDATAPEKAKAKLDGIPSTDTRSEYQKWLDGQNGSPRDERGSGNKPQAGWYQTTTPEERAAYFRENPTEAKISEMGMKAWQALNPMGIASAQEKYSPGLFSQYMNETQGFAPSTIANMAAQYGMYNNPDAYGPSGDVSYSSSDVPAANPMGQDPAQQAQAAQAAAQAAAEQRTAADRNSQMDNASRGSWM